MNRSEYEQRNRTVLSCCLKTDGDGAEVTSDARSFHMVAPETGKQKRRYYQTVAGSLPEPLLSKCIYHRLGRNKTAGR